MARSLKDYYDSYFWINYLVYMLYVIIKYAVVIYLSIISCQQAYSKRKYSVKKKTEESRREENDTSKRENSEAPKGENSKESTSDTNTTLDDVESKCAPKKTTCCQWFQPMKWIEWSVKLIFRNQLDLEDKLESSTNQKTPQVRGNGHSNGEDGPKIELNHRSTVLLFTLIATFGLLAIGSALNVILLSVTHTCTEAPNINCYPQPINKVEVQNAGLNISTNKPIEDCSFWNSEGVSDKVSFICYQLVFNVEIFLAIIGGLSTVFVATMRAIIRVLLWCTRKCGKTMQEKYRKCLKPARYARYFRYALFGIFSLIELLLAIFSMVLQGTGTSDNDTPGVMFLTTHAAEIVLAIGIIPTLLLLPWESYATRENGNQPAENKGPTDQKSLCTSTEELSVQ